MLIYKDNPSATLIQGLVKAPEDNHYTLHSWIEFYEFGSRWILDITWNFPVPVPISVGEEQLGNRNIRRIWTCTHEDFWSSRISMQFYNAISHSESSYILNLLNVYAPAFNPSQKNTVKVWGFKYGGDDYGGSDTFNYFNAQLRVKSSTREAAIYLDPGGVPVTQGIINAHIKKPNREQLPRKVWLREKKLLLNHLQLEAAV